MGKTIPESFHRLREEAPQMCLGQVVERHERNDAERDEDLGRTVIQRPPEHRQVARDRQRGDPQALSR